MGQPSKRRYVLCQSLTVVSDVLFCVVCALLLLLLLYAFNHGALRFSAVGAMLCGIGVCHVSLAPIIARMLQCSFFLLRVVFVALLALLSYPLRWSLLRLWRVCRPLRSAVKYRLAAIKQHKDARKKKKADRTIEDVPSPRPHAPHDGRRVFCVGVPPPNKRDV